MALTNLRAKQHRQIKTIYGNGKSCCNNFNFTTKSSYTLYKRVNSFQSTRHTDTQNIRVMQK